MAERRGASKVLVVEPDRGVAAAADAFLTAAGCQVRCASSADEAGRAAAEFKPDLALVDLELPGTTTADLLKALREATEGGCRFGGLTAGAEHAVLERARGLGIDRFVLKSPGVVSFRDTLLRCLGPGESIPAKNRKILVVDDEEPIRRVLTRFLEGKGYEVESAENGEQALVAARYFKPAVIMLDINMPGMDGVEALRNLSRLYPGIGVIMVTANTDDERARECLRLGASDYISKPFDLETLETSLMVKLLLS